MSAAGSGARCSHAEPFVSFVLYVCFSIVLSVDRAGPSRLMAAVLAADLLSECLRRSSGLSALRSCSPTSGRTR